MFFLQKQAENLKQSSSNTHLAKITRLQWKITRSPG